MKLSVIIPTLNEDSRIATAVKCATVLGGHEVIVADGQSDDRTAQIARNNGATVVLAERGRGRQLNAGAAAATGDVFLFLHADTWLVPAAAAQIRKAVEAEGACAGAFRQRIDADAFPYRLLERGNALRARWCGVPYGDQGIFVRRELFAEIGGYPPIPIMEDVLFMRALRKRTWPALLEGPIHVSARRWRRHGLVRQTACNWAILIGERLGVSPAQLAAWYRPEVK